MITVLNRKELTTTYNINEQARVRDILNANGIDYDIKVVDRMSPTPMAAGTRSRTGTFGQNQDSMKEYVIYVKKKDYEQAISLIR